MNFNKKLLDDLKVFSGPYLESKDIDPVYPVLKKVNEIDKLSLNKALWRTIWYITWYHLGSAEKCFKLWPKPLRSIQFGKHDTGSERRGFRGEIGAQKAFVFVNAMINLAPLDEWINIFISNKNSTENPKFYWKKMFDEFQKIPYCGTWAAFKWCDLLKNVHGYSITSPDIGYGGGGPNAGPIPGMMKLTKENWIDCAVNKNLQEEIYNELTVNYNISLNGLEEMETLFCDFNSMINGHYYVGHDLDKQMEDIASLQTEYWDARKLSFPEKYLGESNGWFGVRKKLNSYYLQTGKIFLGGPL